MKLINEPTMEQIDDYNNQESKEKRKTIGLIILGLLIFAGVLSYIKITNNSVSDYIGTHNNPGINVTPN
ncbi:hypothetical protein MNB_SV-14-425 [hydrothermal vent metagenome]|uniref:Uncharacterized protein n=1 Tax=hydrothermal vent metagenome TaxID=652676 RepID=A0A1W1CQ99_9ZZZZ